MMFLKLILCWISIYNIHWMIVFIVKEWMSMCFRSVCDFSKIWDLIKWLFVGCWDDKWVFLDRKGYQIEDGWV